MSLQSIQSERLVTLSDEFDIHEGEPIPIREEDLPSARSTSLYLAREKNREALPEFYQIGPSYKWRWQKHLKDTSKQNPNAITADRDAMGGSLGGTSVWVGGVLAPNGKIYGIPFNGGLILIIDVATGIATRDNMGADFNVGGNYKFVGGVLAPNGKIYGITAWHYDILIIDVAAGTAILDDMGLEITGAFQWSGGVLGPDGLIYGMPRDSTDILIIDPVTDTAIRSDMDVTMDDSNKWYGATLGLDGVVYGIPSKAGDLLRISPRSQTKNFDASILHSTFLNIF